MNRLDSFIDIRLAVWGIGVETGMHQNSEAALKLMLRELLEGHAKGRESQGLPVDRFALLRLVGDRPVPNPHTDLRQPAMKRILAEISADEVERLAGEGVTLEELAEVLEIGKSTFRNKYPGIALKRHPRVPKK